MQGGEAPHLYPCPRPAALPSHRDRLRWKTKWDRGAWGLRHPHFRQAPRNKSSKRGGSCRPAAAESMLGGDVGGGQCERTVGMRESPPTSASWWVPSLLGPSCPSITVSASQSLSSSRPIAVTAGPLRQGALRGPISGLGKG